MGDRYEIIKECPYCGKETEGGYAPSCEHTSDRCEHCKKEFEIKMDFKFIKKYGGKNQTDVGVRNSKGVS